MQKNKYISKKFIIVAVIIFFAVLSATVGILELVHRSSLKTESSAEPTKVSTPSEIIKKYSESDTFAERNNAYVKQENTPLSAHTIVYQPSDKYAIHIAPDTSVEYSRKDATIKTNDTALYEATQTFLKDEGMKALQESDTSLFSTYDSPQTVCQVTNRPFIIETAAAISLACVKKETITARYEALDKRLSMYASAAGSALANVVTVTSVEVTEGDKQLDLLNVYGDSYGYTLIFAAVNEQWEYLGKKNLPLEDPSVDTNLPADVKAAISDAKYGDFITKNVQ